MEDVLEQTAAEKLAELVRKYEAIDGDLDMRAKALLRAVKRSPDVYAAMMEPHELPVARELVRSAQRRTRSTLWARPTSPDERVSALAYTNSLMDFRLPSGIALRAATANDVNSAAYFYAAQAQDMGWKARWLGKVAERLDADKTVGDCLTDTDLATLKEDAK